MLARSVMGVSSRKFPRFAWVFCGYDLLLYLILFLNAFERLVFLTA